MSARKGFTLIELLVVVLIIGILAAIALPQYQIAVEKSRMSEAASLIKTIARANEGYFLATGSYAPDLSVLDVDVPGDDYTYQGQKRRQTRYFIYTTIPAAGSPDTLALAQRIPFGSYYYLAVNKQGKVSCYSYSTRGEEACTWFNSSY
jgi:prepilin-type N-terminal cleavage/methylation domain-containing protein